MWPTNGLLKLMSQVQLGHDGDLFSRKGELFVDRSSGCTRHLVAEVLKKTPDEYGANMGGKILQLTEQG